MPTGSTVQFSTERYGLCIIFMFSVTIIFMVPCAVGDDRQHTAHMMKHEVIMEHVTSMHSILPHPEFEGGGGSTLLGYHSPLSLSQSLQYTVTTVGASQLGTSSSAFLAMNMLYALYEHRMARCSVICFSVS
jgi:hypothetical protein